MLPYLTVPATLLPIRQRRVTFFCNRNGFIVCRDLLTSRQFPQYQFARCLYNVYAGHPVIAVREGGSSMKKLIFLTGITSLSFWSSGITDRWHEYQDIDKLVIYYIDPIAWNSRDRDSGAIWCPLDSNETRSWGTTYDITIPSEYVAKMMDEHGWEVR